MLTRRLLEKFPLLATILTVFTVVDALRRPAPVWAAAGRNRWRWVAAMIALPGIGPALYRRRAVPDLDRASIVSEHSLM